MAISNNLFDVEESNPYGLGVNAPYVILYNNPKDIEKSIILSQSQGTLLSYVEDLNPDNGNYEIVLELIDPDGLFMSKMFSFHRKHIKEFFTKMTGNLDLPDGIFRKILDEEIKKIVVPPKIERESSIEVIQQFKSVDELSLEQYTSAAQLSLSRIQNTSPSENEDLAAIQYAIEDLGYNPEIYMEIGFGPPEVTQGYENRSKARKLNIIKLSISQDSGRDQVVTVVLGPHPETSERVRDFPLAPFQTSSEKGGISYFPDSTGSIPYVLLEGTFKNSAQYQTLEKSKLPLKKLEQDNSSILVSMLENLLHDYLKGSGTLPLVFLAPQLDAKIREAVDPDSKGFLNGEVVSRLARALRECFIEVVADQNVLSKTLIETNSAFGDVAVLVDSADLTLNPGDTVLRAGELYLKWSLKLRVNDDYSKIENVKAIISALYKKFNVVPNDITHTVVTSTDHKKMIVRKLFENETKSEKVANERQRRDNRRRGTNFGETVTTSYFTNYYASKAKRTESTYIRGRFEDPLAKYFRADYWKDPTKYLGIDSVRYTDVGRITEQDYIDGKIPDILLIGDDFFIRSIIYPQDPDFAVGSYEKYIETLAKISEPLKSKLYCNAFKFLSMTGKDTYTYYDYIKEFNDKIYKSEIGVKSSGLVPDEFSMFVTEIEQSYLTKIPIFIANKENSNVISITSKEDGFAFAEFSKFFSITKKEGIKSIYEVLRPVRGESKYLFKLTDEEIDKIVDRIMRNTFNNVSMVRTIETLTNSDDALSDTNPEIRNLKEYYKTFIEEIKKSKLITNKNVDVQEVVNYLTYLDNLGKQTRTIVLKVPPQFYISSLETLRLPVMLFHENPFISTASSPFSKRSVLSGLYEVIGYKHTITDSECYTELVLQRNPLSDSYSLKASI